MEKGLNKEQVEESRKRHGENIIKEKEPDTFYKRLKDSFLDPMIKLLLFISLILGMLSYMGYGEFKDIIGIVITIMTVTIISTIIEMKAENGYKNTISNIQKDICKVYRDGLLLEVTIDNIVVGDHVLLQAGDNVPCDGVLISGEVSVDNSLLNSEIEQCNKIAIKDYRKAKLYKIGFTKDELVDESSLFRGTSIVSGTGIILVQRVGMSTMIGKMAIGASNDNVVSPLKAKLADLANLISKFAYLGALIIAAALMIQNVLAAGSMDLYKEIGTISMIKDILEALMVAVAIIIMAVPEGLPYLIAKAIMRNSSKMIQNNVLVKKTIGLEAAGSLNILFTNKTGIITKSELEVSEFFDGQANNTYRSSREIRKYVSYCIGKNTTAIFNKQGKVIGGNTTDKALLKFLTEREFKKIIDVEVEKSQEFNSINKYSAARLKDITVYKGDPEALLKKSSKCMNIGGKLYDIDKDKINKKIDNLSNKSMKVVAFAYSESDLDANSIPDDLIIVGFVAIKDEIREESKQAIKEVKDAEIQVVMITGDRSELAEKVAKDSGIIENDDDILLTSEELNKMKDGEVKEILHRIRVVSKATSKDKIRLLKLAQDLDLVCGITYDGFNDSEILNGADVGFSMVSGTDRAKEASDIVILNDSFKAIKNAILYGRTIHNNILKLIKFQLTISISALLVNVIAPFIEIGQPLSITHILWINLIMNVLGVIALGTEPASKTYMDEKPKKIDESIISDQIKNQIMCLAIWITLLSLVFLKLPFFALMFEDGLTHLSGYFTLFVLTVVFNSLNVRTEEVNILKDINKNKNYLRVMSIIVIVQITLTFVGGEILNIYPMTLNNWLVIFALSALIIPVDMLRKCALEKENKSE